ncbi:MAG: GGDEF and EAL domain-containing protein, partial [Oscillospiraceae bacterium]|nr:GGDEF and EAL domain-containing protein [Oscillospiraceae bacterium]
SGEFSYVRSYAYNTLIEKTENRKNYIQTELQQKTPFVKESAEKMNSIVGEILGSRGKDISALKTDKVIDRLIMEESVDSLIYLLRRSTANDVYLILDTGDLYNEDVGKESTRAAMYLRDLDSTSDSGYSDLMMEIGFSNISVKYGIALDSGWKLHFEPNEADDFYFKTLETARNNPQKSDLGYWSGFSSPSRGTVASMKYTVPLVYNDGTVYGVIGIGLTETSILSRIPSNDFISQTACYVLAHNIDNSTRFDIITHSGAAFTRLVGNKSEIDIGDAIAENIRGFKPENGIELAGNVQYISLYNYDSPYYYERWALISVADRNSVLAPLTILSRSLLISAGISLAISIVIVVLVCRAVVKPITSAIKTMNSSSYYNHVVRFSPSNIYELDAMTDAITQLQINVQAYASQVSQMIRIANVGLGTFMYDRADDSVFVGQSLLQLLNFDMDKNEDVVMSRDSFLNNIIERETRLAITESFESSVGYTAAEYVKDYCIEHENGEQVWRRLSLIRNMNKSIGILQDITDEMLEKQRIEYERDYDGLTGLLNRKAYYRCLDELFREPAKLGVAAILMIDLDNLKYVNDTYGHDFGDDYIKTAANVLKKFRDCGAFVSRLSGDEFNVCFHGFSSKDEIRGIIENVRTEMRASYCLLADGTHFKLRASAGLSWYPDDANNYEMMMKYADFAMYTIKQSQKGGVAEFDMTAYNRDAVLLTGVEEMERIIDECSVRYAFHSIVNAHTGEVYGYEALIRPQSTILQTPLDLIRIAKASARMNEIEYLTWTKSLKDFKEQIDAGNIPKDCHIFINSLSNCAIEPYVADELEVKYKDLVSQIVLEVLEGESENEEYNERKKRRMKKWNAQIALDDFGTGYNSEYALITIQPNIVKIDRSIISGCDKDVSRRMIITNLIKLVKTKNILILAEGVETEDELRTVISCGVDLIQGYYINRPVFEPEPIPPEIVEKIRRYNSLS